CEQLTYHRGSSAEITGISGRSTPSAPLRLGAFASNSHITEDHLRRSPESAGDPHLRPLCALAPLREIHISQTIICGNHRIPREIHAFGRAAPWRLCEQFTYHRGSSAEITGISGRSTPSAALRLGAFARDSHITD